MKENVVFYFSGTGNSYQVAKDLSGKLADCEVANIADISDSDYNDVDRVGIVFPTYFWGIPNIVKKFLGDLKVSKGTYIYAIATCGGTPGASLDQIDDILKRQDRHLSAGFYVIMPDNYILIYDADLPEKQEEKFKKEKEKLEYIAKVVKVKEQIRFEHSKLFIDHLIGKQLNQLIVKKYPTKDKEFVVSDTCIGCGRCQKACSVKNIKLVEGKPEWQHHCEFCMGCLQSCPKSAINWKNKTQKRKRYYNPNVIHELLLSKENSRSSME
jgi:ferredoxin